MSRNASSRRAVAKLGGAALTSRRRYPRLLQVIPRSLQRGPLRFAERAAITQDADKRRENGKGGVVVKLAARQIRKFPSGLPPRYAKKFIVSCGPGRAGGALAAIAVTRTNWRRRPGTLDSNIAARQREHRKRLAD